MWIFKRVFFFIAQTLFIKRRINHQIHEFIAAKVYIGFYERILLGIPGSGAFKIFHPVLYNKALDTFKLALKLHLVKQSPKKKPKKSQQPKKRSRAGSVCSGISDADWLDDSDDEGGTLSAGEVQDLTDGLNHALYSVLVMLDHCPLKRSQESLDQTILELVELTHLETAFANLDFNQSRRRSDLSALAYNAYAG